MIIIPVYNEEWNIQRIIRSLRAMNPLWDLLVVNDASKDRSGTLASEEGVHVINLPYNLGIGGCVQTGFKFAKRMGYDYALQFDGDGQHLVAEIDKLLTKVKSGDCDVAIGSRFLERNRGYRSSATRRVGIRFFRVLNGVLIGSWITDSTSGFRAYNSKAIALLAECYPHDYPEPEAIVLLQKNGFKIEEVPSKMHYRRGGQSSISRYKGLFYMTKVSLAMFMAAIRPQIS